MRLRRQVCSSGDKNFACKESTNTGNR